MPHIGINLFNSFLTDIGKVNKAEIKEAMDGVLKKMQGFDFTKFKEELGKRGF